MKKSLGVHPYLFPQPTLMIGTYDENGTPDVMMMAWGGVSDDDIVSLNIGERHQTTKNIRARGAFTLAVPSVDTLAQSDFFGTASANQVEDKFARSGLHAEKAPDVDAPVITEYPLTLECEVVRIDSQPSGMPHILGRIVDVLADESVLGDDGKVDIAKLGAFAFDPFHNGYYAIGEQVGTAWKSGNKYLGK